MKLWVHANERLDKAQNGGHSNQRSNAAARDKDKAVLQQVKVGSGGFAKGMELGICHYKEKSYRSMDSAADEFVSFATSRSYALTKYISATRLVCTSVFYQRRHYSCIV